MCLLVVRALMLCARRFLRVCVDFMRALIICVPVDCACVEISGSCWICCVVALCALSLCFIVCVGIVCVLCAVAVCVPILCMCVDVRVC